MKKKFLSFAIAVLSLICVICNFNIVSANNDGIKNAYANILKTYIDDRDIYCVYDIDKNGTPELIVKSGTCEANYYYHYYAVFNDVVKKIAERRGGHVELYSNPSGEGILEYWVHQGPAVVTLLTLNNGTLSEQRLVQPNDFNFYFNIKAAFPGCKKLDGEWDSSYGYYKCNYVNNLTHLNEWFYNDSISTSKIAKPSTYTTNSVNQSTSHYGSIYENITTEILQIQSYISKSMYIEVINLCNKVLNTRKISDADINLLNEYKNAAQTAYKAYVDDLNKNKTTQYYISDWCMGYKFFVENAPERINWSNVDLSTYDRITIYTSSDATIMLNSYKIDHVPPFHFDKPIGSLNDLYNVAVEYHKSLLRQDLNEGYGGIMEILSENNTTIGNIPARQITMRRTENKNRYGTNKYYDLQRYIYFQYGEWLYELELREFAYLWSDDFWNKMELVRNSISFY